MVPVRRLVAIGLGLTLVVGCVGGPGLASPSPGAAGSTASVGAGTGSGSAGTPPPSSVGPGPASSLPSPGASPSGGPSPAPGASAAEPNPTATRAPSGTRSPSPPPTASPRPSPAPSLVVALAQNGSTLHLAVGQRFLLDLGSSAVWAVTIADPHVLAQVSGVALPPGAQGVFVALARGATTLSAIGSPPCASGICPLYRIAFRVTLDVG